MSDAVGSSRIRLTVAWSPSAGRALEVEVEVAAGASVLDAVRAAGIDIGIDIDMGDTRSVGIWGRACSLDTAVRDGDRVEIYRPLQVDAMEARRRRAAKR